MYDIAIITLRVAFFPKDADAFAELEKDPLVKSRFEEEAASELQQSWNRGKGERENQGLPVSSRALEEGNALTPDILTKQRTSDEEPSWIDDQNIPGRRASLTHTGYDEEIEQRFGAVIRKPFRRRLTSGSA